MRNGWPHLYYQFLSNVMRAGLTEHIIPFPQTSQNGLTVIREMGIKPELIYVDASHEYIDVKQDLRAAWECVAEEGIIFGDDYINWPGVTRAVDEFSLSRNLVLMGCPGKFLGSSPLLAKATSSTCCAKRIWWREMAPAAN
jgi:hypothetical protein